MSTTHHSLFFVLDKRSRLSSFFPLTTLPSVAYVEAKKKKEEREKKRPNSNNKAM